MDSRFLRQDIINDVPKGVGVGVHGRGGGLNQWLYMYPLHAASS